MTHPELALRRARRAYERAHVVSGLRGLATAVVLVVVAVALHPTSSAMWLVAATLAATLAVLGWRGGAWRRGAVAGVVAGLPPLLAPAVVFALTRTHCTGCETAASWPCLIACFGSSSLVGIFVGTRAIVDASPVRFAVGALATAALTGLLGCATTGLGGATGIVVGVIAGGLTGWWVAGRAAHA
ncbi:MAG TPA: hypothetical protein VFQ53_32580 [Kofleriaceae bacterium]|nr:hypothetical protein [Kofleriaceae bacterium]